MTQLSKEKVANLFATSDSIYQNIRFIPFKTADGWRVERAQNVFNIRPAGEKDVGKSIVTLDYQSSDISPRIVEFESTEDTFVLLQRLNGIALSVE